MHRSDVPDVEARCRARHVEDEPVEARVPTGADAVHPTRREGCGGLRERPPRDAAVRRGGGGPGSGGGRDGEQGGRGREGGNSAGTPFGCGWGCWSDATWRSPSARWDTLVTPQGARRLTGGHGGASSARHRSRLGVFRTSRGRSSFSAPHSGVRSPAHSPQDVRKQPTAANGRSDVSAGQRLTATVSQRLPPVLDVSRPTARLVRVNAAELRYPVMGLQDDDVRGRRRGVGGPRWPLGTPP